MMDRNREARRAAAMSNGLPRRRHRTTTSGSLRESPEHEGPLELQETAARLRDRTVKKDRDREMRDRDRDREHHRERDRDRLNRSKRRRGDKYLHGINREDGGGGGGGDEYSSDESVNDEDEDDDGRVRYVPPSNHAPMASSSPGSTLTSHRKSYPPPSKVYRVAPTWKAPDEMIGVSIPRKARSASTKRGHDCWSSAGGVTGEVNRQPSSSPVRSTMTASATVVGGVTAPSPSPAPPMSPSSSNISIKKKIATNNGLKQRPPKSSSRSSPSIQDEIEIEVAEVLYGLMRQSHAPSKQHQDGLTNDRSTLDSKSRVSSPVNNHASPLTTVAPKRKRPRPYPEDTAGPRSNSISSTTKAEPDQATKTEAASLSLGFSGQENGPDLVNSQDLKAEVTAAATVAVGSNGVLSEGKQGLVEESGGIRGGGGTSTKVEEASSSSPKLESPLNHDRFESSTTTSINPNSSLVEPDNHRDEKIEIDLMAPPDTEEEMAEYGGGGGDEKAMVTDRETDGKMCSTKPKEEEENDNKEGVKSNKGVDIVELNNSTTQVVEDNLKVEGVKLNLNANDKSFDLHLDLEKSSVNVNVNDEKLIFQKPAPPKISKDDANTDNKSSGGQSGSAPPPMPVPGGWHGGLAPMGYVGPGVVSMDGTPMASPPIQTPHFMFSQPKPKRCATHCYIARSISVHQHMMKMNPFWPAAAAAAAAAGTAPLFGGKPYNLNMVPSADLHGAGRGVVVNSSQDNKGQPFTFFPSQPAASSKDKSPQTPSVPDSAQKKQFLLQPALPPGAPNNILHAALFFPMGQQQAAVPNIRPGSTKSQSKSGASASTSAPTSAPMGAAGSVSNVGPAMSFSYPNMGANETQFMAILGNSAYPFPLPAHVGAATPYRGTHPQAMPFFNGSFYSSQMLHPSQMQQQQAAQTSQSMQIQQQNLPNPSISTASSSSQKHLQNQQLRPQGSNAPGGGTSNQGGLQNFQAPKGRTSQPHHDMGGEDSPSTADSRTRQNMSVYGQNFTMPFNSPNFALMTSASAMGGGGNNATGVPNGNLGDKKQQQHPQQNPAFPMSFASLNGTTTPGLDMSSIAQNHAIMMQSPPEAAIQNYQLMAAQAAQQKKNSYRNPEDGKTGPGPINDTSNMDEERKAMAMRASAALSGQSIAFSRDLGDNSISTMPGNTVVDSSARSINLVHGSYTRPSRSPGQSSVSNSNASNPSQPQQQMLFPKQQQFVAAPSASSGRSKTPTTNGNIYPEHLASPSIMAAKFPNSLSGFPPLVQTNVGASQSPQWKNSSRPNASQVSSPSVATSAPSNIKNLPQQPGRSQPNHTQISFAPPGTNPKASSTPQGQQTQSNNQGPSSPMVMGSPSTSSVSKGASASPRATASASTGSKAGGQGSTLASQQGKNSQSPSLSNQKQSILGNHHIMSASSNSGSKPQMQQSQLQTQLSKQNLQQAQLCFSNFVQQASANASAPMGGSPYYLQRQQQQGLGSKSQGSAGSVSSSGMLSLCNPVSGANSNTSDPVKAVAAAANGMKGAPHSQGMLHAASQFAAQSAGGAHALMPAGFPYVHAVSTSVQVKPTEQKQPAGE